jgi:hypothetical protein
LLYCCKNDNKGFLKQRKNTKRHEKISWDKQRILADEAIAHEFFFVSFRVFSLLKKPAHLLLQRQVLPVAGADPALLLSQLHNPFHVLAVAFMEMIGQQQASAAGQEVLLTSSQKARNIFVLL